MSDHSLEPGVVLGGPAALEPAADPHAETRRLQRLADGVRQLRAGGGTLKLGERLLMVLGGIIAPLGIVLVIIGWSGAAHTPNLFEQIPYLISGGLLGLGLVFIGSFFYFAHWMTELVKEHRAQSAAMIDAITHLEEVLVRTAGAGTAAVAGAAVATSAANGARPAGALPAEEVVLVATERGTMAHRPDCVVVAGKTGVRSVTAADGLAPCKLCDPYLTAAN